MGSGLVADLINTTCDSLVFHGLRRRSPVLIRVYETSNVGTHVDIAWE
jgi:hypothetical protein